MLPLLLVVSLLLPLSTADFSNAVFTLASSNLDETLSVPVMQARMLQVSLSVSHPTARAIRTGVRGYPPGYIRKVTRTDTMSAQIAGR